MASLITPPQDESANPTEVELSLVMPCLNEAETLAACIQEAQEVCSKHNIAAEVIVADNGSSDGSQQIARGLGARIINVRQKGYGSALQGGIAAARGRYVVMYDSDLSYDLGSLPAILARLREGYDLVMGNRFAGGIQKGAMPWSHRWIGNPLFSSLGRLFFNTGAGDIYCGLRGFSAQAYKRMGLRATGMEFANEMVVKASLLRMRVTEVPTILRPDGRSRSPHLRRWRDGWRTLRFLLLYAPRWLFLWPGLLIMVVGAVTIIWLMPGMRQIGTFNFDTQTLLVAGTACIIGYQLVVFAVLSEVFMIHEGFREHGTPLRTMFRYVTLEVGVVCGGVMILIGVGLLGVALLVSQNDHNQLAYPHQTMRLVVPAVVMVAVGAQTLFSSLLVSMIGRLGERTTGAFEEAEE